MRGRSMMLGVVIGAVLLCGWWIRPAASVVGASARRWEYATYRHGAGQCVWDNGRDKALTEKDDSTIFRRLGGKEKSHLFSIVDLTTLFGRQGWELIEVKDDGAGTTYWFKRPA